MSTLVLRNIDALVTGVLAAPRADASAIRVEDGIIAAIGGADVGRGDAEVVVDRRGTTVIPGLVDSHCHVVLGDDTPRRKQVDVLDSYVHGGITTVVSAGDGVHAPGRAHDPAASKALGPIVRGDIPGISCVVIDGRVRVGRSRDTALATRLAGIHGVPGLAAGHEPGVRRTPP